MPGQLGNEQVTVQNLKVVAIDEARNLIMVQGAVPGFDEGIVFVQDAKKRSAQKVGPVPAGLKVVETKEEPKAEVAVESAETKTEEPTVKE